MSTVRDFVNWLGDRDINLVTFSSDGGAFIEDPEGLIGQFEALEALADHYDTTDQTDAIEQGELVDPRERP